MALPPGITPKTVTVGIASFFDGTLAEGTATITAPVNVVHTPSNRPIFSSVMSKRFANGEATFDLCPTDAEGLNRRDWTYILKVTIQGAVKQPDPIWFTLPTAGPDTVDLDGLVTVPSSAGTPISVDVLTTTDINTGDYEPTGAWDWTGATVTGLSAGGAVDSVNGQTGAVTLDAADIGAQAAATLAADTAAHVTDGSALDTALRAAFVAHSELDAAVLGDYTPLSLHGVLDPTTGARPPGHAVSPCPPRTAPASPSTRP